MGLTMGEPCPELDIQELVLPELDTSKPEAGANLRQWFALTVKYQHERRVDGILSANGVDTFLPLYRARRQWSDRAKDIDAPLFPGYVFGRFRLHDRARIMNMPGVARIVSFAGLPTPVAEQEIENVRAALASKLSVRPWPYLLKAGDRVRIERGPLRGLEGTLLRDGSFLRLVLSVEMLQRSLAVEVDPDMVGPLSN
jgi:transcription antitermination factor NusG